MIANDKVQQLHDAFQRIFALPVTRSTFRELQNAILLIFDRNEEQSNQLFHALLGGQLAKEKGQDELLKFVKDFTVLTRLAKDVFEKGEFINLVTSDIVSHGNVLAFLNRFRRVDGQELQFLSDTDGTFNLIEHFVSRLEELNKSDSTSGLLSSRKEKVVVLKERLDRLIG